MTHWQSELLCTAFNTAQLPPPSLPEVAFVGRSNVGKSTLINALLGRRIAKVSSKPGKTRSLNFYRVAPAGGAAPFCLVDLPGYGYADRSRGERREWWRFVNDYFSSERNIAFVVHLVDFRHGPLDNDRELTAWLDAMDMPRLIVFTKGDKLPKGRRRGAYMKYMSSGLASVAPPLITEGKNDEETDRLRGLVTQIIRELERLG